MVVGLSTPGLVIAVLNVEMEPNQVTGNVTRRSLNTMDATV